MANWFCSRLAFAISCLLEVPFGAMIYPLSERALLGPDVSAFSFLTVPRVLARNAVAIPAKGRGHVVR